MALTSPLPRWERVARLRPYWTAVYLRTWKG
jgi:hypothetical protein